MDRGTGVPIVFLHAGSGNAALWEKQVEFFSRAGYRCIAYDRHGRAAAADELEALVSQLALERFHLVGTAAGGIVAVDYALCFPKRLRSNRNTMRLKYGIDVGMPRPPLGALDKPWNDADVEKVVAAVEESVGERGALAP